MTHYDISYKGMNREEADAKAVADIREYCTPKQFDALIEYAEAIADNLPKFTVRGLHFCMEMLCGIQGYPVHAFSRKYCLKAYREYMAEPLDGGPVVTDDWGFPVEAVVVIENDPEGRTVIHEPKANKSPWSY